MLCGDGREEETPYAPTGKVRWETENREAKGLGWSIDRFSLDGAMVVSGSDARFDGDGRFRAVARGHREEHHPRSRHFHERTLSVALRWLANAVKKWVKRIAVGVVGLAILLVGVPWAIGSFMRRDHLATGRADVHASRAEVWKTIVDFESMPSWAPDMGKIARLPDEKGKPRFRQTDGANITFAFVEIEEPNRLVVDLVDDAGYFGGTWTYELGDVPSGTRVTITERGWAGPGFFRFMLWLFGADSTIKDYLSALQKKLP